VVIDYYEFYCGTYAIVVDHGSFIVRYGEVASMARGVAIKSRVEKGQVIGKMGVLCGGSAMLHFEKYKGTLKGNLTVRENLPFQRRADLEDPTSFLNGLKNTVKNSI
jgi:murein DD-endopeptidase MepM/ murein hydrolase activator NlpD